VCSSDLNQAFSSDNSSEVHEDYAEFGGRHSWEQRVEAGVAAIALLYGADWSESSVAYYLRPAYERLLSFAGEDGFNAAADELYLMALPDRPIPQLVEEGVQALKKAFDWSAAPHAKRYWQEVVRTAKRSVRAA